MKITGGGFRPLSRCRESARRSSRRKVLRARNLRGKDVVGWKRSRPVAAEDHIADAGGGLGLIAEEAKAAVVVGLDRSREDQMTVERHHQLVAGNAKLDRIPVAFDER